MTASIKERLEELPEGTSILEVFTVEEWQGAIASAIKEPDFEFAIELIAAMAKHYPHDAELIYQTIRVGLAARSDR